MNDTNWETAAKLGRPLDSFRVEDDDDEFNEDADVQYMQNRELSWLTFNERVLDQGADESVPLLERLNFISIFWSNLQEFFMVRVGSLTDLTFIKPPLRESKTGMTPKEQIRAIHERCAELYPIQESYYEHVRGSLAKEGVRHLRPEDLSEEQRNYLSGLVKHNIEPFLSPQIINSRHPFPHLENGKIYILVRLDDEAAHSAKKKKKDKAAKKNKAAEGVVLGLIPLPHQVDRLIKLPGRGYQFILLEHAIEMFAEDIFSMYTIKHTNVICVTRNADMDANQGDDSSDEDYREHMKRLLKQRARLAPVRLECERPLSPVMEKHMLKKLGLKRYQVYDTTVPLDLSFTWGLGSKLSEKKRAKLSNPPFAPAWPTCFDRNRRIIDQVQEKEVLLSYPYESMDPFVQLLREASVDPTVISIKITLYRLASQSHLAEALIAAAENGKEVTALFELRARFDESNNIEWSQRFEEAGCNVLYGFRDYKVHSKICCITRQTENGIQHITQLGTGNYNEKTAKLYTDLSFITTNEAFGRDAVEFFKNMQLENVSDNYSILRVAPLQIKQMLLENIEAEIQKAENGEDCGIFMKANSVTDKDVIEKLSEASQAGVSITLFIRGICCIVPGIKGATDNVRVVSIVGRLLEHSRIYCFGAGEDARIYLSSADLMTRNLDKRVEIAWPIFNADIKKQIREYLDVCMQDTAKLRQLRRNFTYTPLGSFCEVDEEGNALAPFDAQNALIEKAALAAKRAVLAEAGEESAASHESGEETSYAEEQAGAVEEEQAPLTADDALDGLLEVEVEPAQDPVLPPTDDIQAETVVPFASPVDASAGDGLSQEIQPELTEPIYGEAFFDAAAPAIDAALPIESVAGGIETQIEEAEFMGQVVVPADINPVDQVQQPVFEPETVEAEQVQQAAFEPEAIEFDQVQQASFEPEAVEIDQVQQAAFEPETVEIDQVQEPPAVVFASVEDALTDDVPIDEESDTFAMAQIDPIGSAVEAITSEEEHLLDDVTYIGEPTLESPSDTAAELAESQLGENAPLQEHVPDSEVEPSSGFENGQQPEPGTAPETGQDDVSSLAGLTIEEILSVPSIFASEDVQQAGSAQAIEPVEEEVEEDLTELTVDDILSDINFASFTPQPVAQAFPVNADPVSATDEPVYPLQAFQEVNYIPLEEEKKIDLPEIENIVPEDAPTPPVEQGSEGGEAERAFFEKNPGIDMPPKKGGFFSRMFKRD